MWDIKWCEWTNPRVLSETTLHNKTFYKYQLTDVLCDMRKNRNVLLYVKIIKCQINKPGRKLSCGDVSHKTRKGIYHFWLWPLKEWVTLLWNSFKKKKIYVTVHRMEYLACQHHTEEQLRLSEISSKQQEVLFFKRFLFFLVLLFSFRGRPAYFWASNVITKAARGQCEQMNGNRLLDRQKL